MRRRMLRVDRHEAPPFSEASLHQRTARHTRLLVRERNEDVGVHRRERRTQPSRSDDRVHDDVGRGVNREFDQPVGPVEYIDAVNAFAQCSGGAGVGHRPHACGPKRSICLTTVSTSVFADNACTEKSSGMRSTMSRDCVPIDPVEPEDREPRILNPPSRGRAARSTRSVR